MIGNHDDEGKAPREGPDPLERLRGLFGRSPVALTLADATQPDCPLVIANPAFLRLTGYTHEEVIGRNCRFLQADLDNETARAEAREVIAQGGQGQIVFRNRRKTGEPFDNLLFLQGLADRAGGARYVLGSQFELQDSVTERRIDAHLRHIDAAVARAVEAQATLRTEQRRMFADAAYAVANAWLALR
jgi:PAS domain S-box-containing protein